MSLDDIDAGIVTALIKDARASYAVIGNEVGLSAPAVKRRVDRLRASGAITGFSARVDPAALGWTTEAYVELFCEGSTSPGAIWAGARPPPPRGAGCVQGARRGGRTGAYPGRRHPALRAGGGAHRGRAVRAPHPQRNRAVAAGRAGRFDPTAQPGLTE